MALISLDIPAGVVNQGTDYNSEGRWRTANLVRWEQGSMRPVGGWQQRTGSVNVSASSASATSVISIAINTSSAHSLESNPNKVILSGFGTGSSSSVNINDRAYSYTVIDSDTISVDLSNTGLTVTTSETFDATSGIVKKQTIYH